MKLIRLHVENFGRLSNFDMDFTEGLNSMLRENGWGKSTLAAFLRVMFYGLEGGRKRDLSENDRLKYKPWNQGHFGGTMEFEADGKRYLVTRDFGEKDKDCSFRLQDAVTLLDSKDYSEQLGEELFGIDRESFERTSFIDRAGIRYRGINSTIGSKVGSVDQTDDLNNYDVTQEIMKNYLNANSPKKKTGELFRLGDEIQQLERDAGNQGLLEARIEGIKASRDQEREKLEQIKMQRVQAQKEQADLAENKNHALNAKRRGELEAELNTRSQAVKSREESFGDRIPTREELQRLGAKAEETEKHLARLSGFEISSESERYERLKRYFRDGVPKEEEVAAQIENCNAVQDGIQRRLHLEEQESKERKKLEDYSLARERMEMTRRQDAEKAAKERKGKSTLAILFIALGLLLGVLTVALRLPWLLWIPAVIMILAGAILFLIPLVRGGAKESVPVGEEQLLARQEAESRANLEGIKKEMQEREDAIKTCEDAIRSFLEGRGITYSRADAENLLYEMKNRMGEYRELVREKEEKEQDHQRRLEETKAHEKELAALLSSMGLSMETSDLAGIKKYVAETLQSLTSYEKEKREAEAAMAARDEFVKAHPELMSDEAVLSEEEIKQREEELAARTKELSEAESLAHESVSVYNRNLDDAYESAEALQEKKERLEALKERRDLETARYQLVEKTQEYLKAAKESFTARFMQPIKSAFDRYYELMTGVAGSGKEFQIDANMNIFRKEEGSFHDIEAQSEGYADLIGLCIRMALLDVMYEKEKPLVIMDDPFASLDQEHLSGAKEFMKEIAEKYQILYLTCHDARIIE